MADENLFDIRLRRAGYAANGVDIDGRIAPAKNSEPFFADDAFENAFASRRSCGSTGRKTMPTPYSPARGKSEAEFRRFAREKFVGNLNEQSGAVAGFRDRIRRRRDA